MRIVGVKGLRNKCSQRRSLVDCWRSYLSSAAESPETVMTTEISLLSAIPWSSQTRRWGLPAATELNNSQTTFSSTTTKIHYRMQSLNHSHHVQYVNTQSFQNVKNVKCKMNSFNTSVLWAVYTLHTAYKALVSFNMKKIYHKSSVGWHCWLGHTGTNLV